MPTLKIQNQIKFKMNFAVLVQKKSSSSVNVLKLHLFKTTFSRDTSIDGTHIPGVMHRVYALLWFDFTHIFQGSFTGTGAIIRLPQCQWSNPGRYG